MKGTLLTLALLLSLLPSVWADGGVVLTQKTDDGLDMTVFAAPWPLRAGPVDFSVLVQKTGEKTPVLDAQVKMAWSAEADAFPAWLPPCCTMEKTGSQDGILGHSQNKILYSAIVPVSSAGPSKLLVQVEHGGTTRSVPIDLTVAPPAPPAVTYWPYLAFPPVAIVLFACHQRLKRKRSSPLV